MVAISLLALIGSVVAWAFAGSAVSDSRAALKAKSAAAGSGATTGAVAVTVHLSDFSISPSSLEISSGGTITVMNMSAATEHNFTIEGTTLATPNIPAGKSAELPIGGLAPGTYVISCSVGGHKAAGMVGSLTVTAGGGGTGSVATTTLAQMTADQMDAAMKAVTDKFLGAATGGKPLTAGVGGQELAATVLSDGTKQFELTAAITKWEVDPGHIVDAWTYNGTVPGPTIRVNVGDKVRVILHNNLPESTVIHFHGLIVPNAMDGVPDVTQPAVKPGASFTYEFTAKGPAVGMYHSHHDATKQVTNGLAGAFLVGDEPLPTGVKLNGPPQLMMLSDSGNIGLGLNGKSFPATAPFAAKLGDYLEVHYMNEGQIAHPMHLHGIAQLVIAKDGFALASPYYADTILVGPGERYTVLIHATEPGAWAWHCHILSHAEKETGMFGMVTALVVA